MHDVIIIGAGLAGTYLAKQLQKDLDIVIIDKSKQIKLDSGIVSRAYEDFLPKKFIKKRIKKIQLISPTNSIINIRSNTPYACLLKRKQLGHYLRKGLNINYETPWKLHIFDDAVHVWTDESHYQAKLIIGADGATSFTRKQLGIAPPRLYPAIRATSPHQTKGPIRVYFNKYFSPDFYAWYIPSNGEHGLIARNPHKYFYQFQRAQGFKYTQKHIKPIPIGHTKSYAKRAILVGDACGQTKPFTGGGIIFTLKGCQIAIPKIKQAIENNDYITPLKEYQKQWHRELLWAIRKQSLLRYLYTKVDNNTIDALFTLYKPEIENIYKINYDKFTTHVQDIKNKTLLKTLLKLPGILLFG